MNINFDQIDHSKHRFKCNTKKCVAAKYETLTMQKIF